MKMPVAALATDFDPAAFPEGAWQLPVELVMACPNTSWLAPVITSRRAQPDAQPLPLAWVFLRGKRFFARIGFRGETHPAVIFALDAWRWQENDR